MLFKVHNTDINLAVFSIELASFTWKLKCILVNGLKLKFYVYVAGRERGNFDLRH